MIKSQFSLHIITFFQQKEIMKHLYFFILLISLSFSSQASINQPFGLFFIQDNKLKQGQDIFEVPTLKTDITVDVQGLFTTTTVKQYFINPTNTFTEAIYLFPLPEKSAVDQLHMKIGGRYSNGIIQKKEEAEKIYEKAKKLGKKTSLISSSRSNIFKTKLANIAPGEMIVVEFRYQEKLMLREGEYSLRIPTVITHRYKVPQDNAIDADGEPTVEYDPEIHSPINDKKNYTINPYTIAVNLNTGFNITTPKSIDALSIDQISSSHFSITLANDTMPSTKDFVLSFKPILNPDPYVRIYGEEVGNDLFLYGLINPQVNLNDLPLTDKSAITIVADVSGSMSGSSLRQMQSILINFINSLPEDHFINIIAFNDTYDKLFLSPKPATSKNKSITLKLNLFLNKLLASLPPTLPKPIKPIFIFPPFSFLLFYFLDREAVGFVKLLHIVFITEALRYTGGMIAGKQGAAQLLDLPPSTLRSKMQNLA